MDVGVTEDYVVQRMREYFPDYKIIEKDGYLMFSDGKYWEALKYSAMAPEQALDFVRMYIANYFDALKNIKSTNGKTQSEETRR